MSPPSQPAILPIDPIVLAQGLDKIAVRLLLPREVVLQVVNHLSMGRNVILTGAPGTGKTDLARMISEVFGIQSKVVTATSEWTTYDVIGGLFPFPKNGALEFKFKPGFILDSQSSKGTVSGQTVRKNGGNWVVIDEFNRAQIDRAFGDLFTALEYLELQVLTENQLPEPRFIAPDFRIIATLNTIDLHFLFQMSDALKRRFAFIDLPVPAWTQEAEEKQKVLQRVQTEISDPKLAQILSSPDFQTATAALFSFVSFVRQIRPLGTAQLITTLTYVVVKAINAFDMMQADTASFFRQALEEGLSAHVIPQLDTLPPDELAIIERFLEVSPSNPASVERFVESVVEKTTDQFIVKGTVKTTAAKLARYWQERYSVPASSWLGIDGEQPKLFPETNRRQLIDFLAGVPPTTVGQPAGTTAPTSGQSVTTS